MVFLVFFLVKHRLWWPGIVICIVSPILGAMIGHGCIMYKIVIALSDYKNSVFRLKKDISELESELGIEHS